MYEIVTDSSTAGLREPSPTDFDITTPESEDTSDSIESTNLETTLHHEYSDPRVSTNYMGGLCVSLND